MTMAARRRHRILYFTDSAAVGGAERVLLATLRDLDRDRWMPALGFHPSPGLQPMLDSAAALGVELHAFKPLPEGLRGARRVPGTAVLMRRLRPDVLHANLTWPVSCKYALFSSIAAGVPAVIATHHLLMGMPEDLSRRLQLRLLATRIDRHVAVSHAIARTLQAKLAIPQSCLTVIPNGIDPDQFNLPPNPEVLGVLTDGGRRPVVLCVARLEEQKGLRYLIEAAVCLPDVAFAVAGDGTLRAELERHAAGLGLTHRFKFLGERQDIPVLLATCDLFVLPSLDEGLPLSVLEAMAAGRPVVATAVGGTGEVVHSEVTGLLVEPGNPGALAVAMHRLLTSPELAGRIASAGQREVRRRFTVRTMVQAVQRVYEETLRV